MAKPRMAWEVTAWSDDIVPVRIEHETKHYIHVGRIKQHGRHVLPATDKLRTDVPNAPKYYDTWADAHAAVVERDRARIASMEANLVKLRADLALLEARKPPKGAK